MKILWICPCFLHPTDRGGQIRTLGILRELHKRHEVHFAGLNEPGNEEGPQRASEYSSRHFAVEHSVPQRTSLKIYPQLLASVLSSTPIAVSRYESAPLQRIVTDLIAAEHYDAIVCDFLSSAPNLADLNKSVLFQHNVETTIWKRHVEQSKSLAKKFYFQLQASKMESYERKICRQSKHVIAVSEIDAERMKTMFEVKGVTSVPTGVDLEYFAPPADAVPVSDMIFCGSMDWLPNVDAVEHFVSETLPLIRQQIPGATFTIAGRSPDARVMKAVEGLSGVTVTGKVKDMRPYLWGSKISVVPMRIGGGTRLKIYECMASGVPVVSTAVGAEGLAYEDGEDILIADDPRSFAAACVRMLTEDAIRRAMAQRALERAQNEFSWEAVSREFEAVVDANRLHYDGPGSRVER
jgi:glycosyltransferase involved in cell wall biosynthesis